MVKLQIWGGHGSFRDSTKAELGTWAEPFLNNHKMEKLAAASVSQTDVMIEIIVKPVIITSSLARLI